MEKLGEDRTWIRADMRAAETIRRGMDRRSAEKERRGME